MSYQVKLTPNAIEHLSSAISYIAQNLQAPENALRWSERLRRQIATLSELPGRYRLTNLHPWHEQGIRQMPVENFLVYYWIDEENHCVWITAIIFRHRDQLSVLLSLPPPLM